MYCFVSHQICQLIYMSRNGMAECELLDLIPNLTWNFLAPLCHDLLDRHVLTYRAGTLIFAHEQVCITTLGRGRGGVGHGTSIMS